MGSFDVLPPQLSSTDKFPEEFGDLVPSYPGLDTNPSVNNNNSMPDANLTGTNKASLNLNGLDQEGLADARPQLPTPPEEEDVSAHRAPKPVDMSDVPSSDKIAGNGVIAPIPLIDDETGQMPTVSPKSTPYDDIWSPATKLSRRLKETQDLIVCPGVYDGLSARIAISVGFDAMYMVSLTTL